MRKGELSDVQHKVLARVVLEAFQLFHLLL